MELGDESKWISTSSAAINSHFCFRAFALLSIEQQTIPRIQKH